VDVSPGKGGHVEVDGVSYSGLVTVPLNPSTDMALKAVPAFGYRFTGWSGDIDKREGDANPIVINRPNTASVTAHFSRVLPPWLVSVVIAAAVIAGIFIYRRKRHKGPILADS
jgi:hypothetical protein